MDRAQLDAAYAASSITAEVYAAGIAALVNKPPEPLLCVTLR